MGKEQDSNYYNSLYANSSKYRKSWNQISPRKKLWSAAASFVKTPGVVDLGSGAGQFAECLFETTGIQYYKGLDFSEKAVRMSRERLVDKRIDEYLGSGDDKRWEFNVVDLNALAGFHSQAFFRFGDADVWTFTILEVLEHVEKDLEILSLVPEGSPVVISVPSFDDEAHCRHFTSKESVVFRYSPYIQIKQIRTPWKWYVVQGIKKTKVDHEKDKLSSPNLFEG